jgi:predicted  nucleic acid-binding Zn-ribbon protein
VREYAIVFSYGKLPMKKIKKDRHYSWKNDEEMKLLHEMNIYFKEGVNVSTLKNDLRNKENMINERKAEIESINKDNKLFKEILLKCEMVFGDNQSNLSERDRNDILEYLKKKNINRNNYGKLKQPIWEYDNKIESLESEIKSINKDISRLSTYLTNAEIILSGTYVQNLVTKENERKLSDYMQSGVIPSI